MLGKVSFFFAWFESWLFSLGGAFRSVVCGSVAMVDCGCSVPYPAFLVPDALVQGLIFGFQL
jgi:hypothetical protein